MRLCLSTLVVFSVAVLAGPTAASSTNEEDSGHHKKPAQHVHEAVQKVKSAAQNVLHSKNKEPKSAKDIEEAKARHEKNFEEFCHEKHLSKEEQNQRKKCCDELKAHKQSIANKFKVLAKKARGKAASTKDGSVTEEHLPDACKKNKNLLQKLQQFMAKVKSSKASGGAKEKVDKVAHKVEAGVKKALHRGPSGKKAAAGTPPKDNKRKAKSSSSSEEEEGSKKGAKKTGKAPPKKDKSSSSEEKEEDAKAEKKKAKVEEKKAEKPLGAEAKVKAEDAKAEPGQKPEEKPAAAAEPAAPK